MNLRKALNYLYPELDVNNDVAFQDDGDGIFISIWNSNLSKPTIKQLEDTWKLIENEVLIESIREKRNELLMKCDWTELPSAQERLTTEQLQAWGEYRQALRDFPAMCDPVNPIWPESPK